MKKIIPTLILCFGLLQVATAQTTPQDTSKKAEITFVTEEHDFGTVKEGVTASFDFKFKNTGKAPLILTDVHPSCSCTAPEWPKEPIKPGATAVIKVAYPTMGRPGAFQKTVTVNSNAKNNPRTLWIRGAVEAVNTQPEAPKPNVPVH